MNASLDYNEFEKQWLDVSNQICERIFNNSEIQKIREAWQQGSSLSFEQRSEFIAICNSVKYQVINELFGDDGTEEFENFKQAWRNWFNKKGEPGFVREGRNLTNAEHIVFSSTPTPEEFFTNFK